MHAPRSSRPLALIAVAALLAAGLIPSPTATAAEKGEAANKAHKPFTLKLWPGKVPEPEGFDVEATKKKAMARKRRPDHVVFVDSPTITVYKPAPEKANGCAVVIAPGGGYTVLAYEHEGTQVAEWLNSIGVTAILMKYRVPRRSNDTPHIWPLQDAQRAIRITRKNAKEWGVDPDRLGILGFSAGGHLTVMTALHGDKKMYEPVDDADKLSAKPSFAIPIYAAYLGDKSDDTKLDSKLVTVDKNTPPMFLAVTQDDKMRGAHAALLFAELTRHKVKAEVHVYVKGGHGYGMRKTDRPVSIWPKLAGDWLKEAGWLAPRAKKKGKTVSTRGK